MVKPLRFGTQDVGEVRITLDLEKLMESDLRKFRFFACVEERDDNPLCRAEVGITVGTEVAVINVIRGMNTDITATPFFV